MDIDLTKGVQVAAVVVGLIAAYGAKADGFRATMSKWFTSKPSQVKASETNKDAALRELIDDSRERGCLTSVNLLNEWQKIRTSDGLKAKGET